MKKIVLSLALSLLFIGCGDKEDSKKSLKVEATTSGKIEVIKSDSPKEIKVKEKAVDKKGDKYYFSYNKDEKKTYTKLDANLRIRSPYEDIAISLLVSKLSKNFIVKCSACHNDYANGIIGPSLLGKDEKFIKKSIMDFKTDTKKNVLMSDLVKMMSVEEIDELAKEIALFNIKIKEMRAK